MSFHPLLLTIPLAGGLWEEHDSVFCKPQGQHLDPVGVLVLLKHLLEKVRLPDRRFHDLQHSAATLLLGMGVHPKVLQEILGHSDLHAEGAKQTIRNGTNIMIKIYD